jgi:hypothetical protein
MGFQRMGEHGDRMTRQGVIQMNPTKVCPGNTPVRHSGWVAFLEYAPPGLPNHRPGRSV